MATVMHYRSYVAVVEYDEDADIFHGRTINLRDIVTFQGRSSKELKKSFAESVEFYLSVCKKKGIEPEKPFTGKFVVRLKPEVHRAAVEAAASSGKSLNAWVAEQLERSALQEA